MRSIDPTPVAEAVQQMLPANASPARNRVKVPTVPVRGNVSDLADP
jgi:hypothetical protein